MLNNFEEITTSELYNVVEGEILATLALVIEGSTLLFVAYAHQEQHFIEMVSATTSALRVWNIAQRFLFA